MRSKKLIVLFSCCLLAFASGAQTIPFEKYTTKNGLISDRITAIAQDEKGYMWFGSYFGVCRYDGAKFEKIELPSQQQNKYVCCLLPANNKMYIGFSFRGGLAEYDQGKITVLNIQKNDPNDSSEVVCMADMGDGSIIVCTGANQVYQFKNRSFRLLCAIPGLGPASMRSVVTDAAKNILIATDAGLYLVSPSYSSYKKFHAGNYIFSITKDARGKLWMMQNTGKEVVTTVWDSYQNGIFVNEKNVYSSIIAKPSLVAGKMANGFWMVEGNNMLTNISSAENILHYELRDQLNTEVKVLYADRENNLWISNEPGLLKVSNFTARSFLFDELAFGGGSIARKNDSVLWTTNAVSLYSVSNQKIRNLNFHKHADYFGALHADASNNLWIGYWNEGVSLTKWKGDELVEEIFFREFDHTKIKAQCFVEDSKGNLWIAGLYGIFRARNGKIVEHIHPKNGLGTPAFVVSMALDEANKTLWLGDNDQGLVSVRYADSSLSHFSYTPDRYIAAKDGLTDPYVRSLYFDKQNNLWIGTRFGGIYRLGTSSKHSSIVNYNASANLSCTRVSQIFGQDASLIWFATCGGIHSYDAGKNEWKHYNTSDGLLNAEVYSCDVDPKKNLIWALSAQGLTSLSAKQTETNISPLVNITAVNILGKPDSAALSSPQAVVYSYKQNSIDFSFTGPSFIDEKKTRYKYMLEGYDKGWSEPVVTNRVSYASLSPGKYVFKVMAINAKGQWSSTPAKFEFEIIMPFYKKPWFIFLGITLLILIAYLVRIQQLQHRYKIERLRLSIARDLHDDVGATLGSINILSKTATRKLGSENSYNEVGTIFQKIGTSAENTLEAMDDIVWSINPDKDKLYDLIIRMREFGIPLFESKNIAFDFHVEGNDEQIIPMNLRRNVFLIYKEIIHNILKHAEATSVHIRLSIHHHLTLAVSDNGKGFDVNVLTRRNGLKNMQSRASAAGGSVKIESNPNGTIINFTAPIR